MCCSCTEFNGRQVFLDLIPFGGSLKVLFHPREDKESQKVARRRNSTNVMMSLDPYAL